MGLRGMSPSHVGSALSGTITCTIFFVSADKQQNNDLCTLDIYTRECMYLNAHAFFVSPPGAVQEERWAQH